MDHPHRIKGRQAHETALWGITFSFASDLSSAFLIAQQPLTELSHEDRTSRVEKPQAERPAVS
jgi:hypothetical protein